MLTLRRLRGNWTWGKWTNDQVAWEESLPSTCLRFSRRQWTLSLICMCGDNDLHTIEGDIWDSLQLTMITKRGFPDDWVLLGNGDKKGDEVTMMKGWVASVDDKELRGNARCYPRSADSASAGWITCQGWKVQDCFFRITFLARGKYANSDFLNC